MNAHVVEASKTRVSTLAGLPSVSASGQAVAPGVRRIPIRRAVSESNAPRAVAVFRVGLLNALAGLAHDDFWHNAPDVGFLVGCVRYQTLLFIVAMAMDMLVAVLAVGVVMIVTSVFMGVTVAAQDEEANEVGKEAGASHDEDEFGLVDLGRLDETGEGFEDDGNAERDEEDGVEEGTKNFGANELYLSVSSWLKVSLERLTPKVNSSVVAFCAATTAHRPMTKEIISLSMWKASAVKAREWARKPAMSSSKKKAVSMMIMSLIRVDLDQDSLRPIMMTLGSTRLRPEAVGSC